MRKGQRNYHSMANERVYKSWKYDKMIWDGLQENNVQNKYIIICIHKKGTLLL